MSYKVLFVLSAIVAVIFGLGFLIVPDRVLPLFGTTETHVALIFTARFFGFASLGLGLVLWFAKDVSDAKIQKNLGVAMLVVSVVGFVLSIVGTMDGSKVIRANVWVPIALFALSGLGYAFMIFLKPKMVQ
jgi:FtsH-binding integral membrane protein